MAVAPAREESEMLARRRLSPLFVTLVVAIRIGGFCSPVAFAQGNEPGKAQQNLMGPVETKADDTQGGSPKAEEPKKAEDPSAKFLKGFYGTLDASVDDTTKGIAGKVATHWDLANFPPDRTTLVTSIHAPPVGRVGWMLALSTNKAGVGYRGDHKIGSSDTKFVYQVEASVSITSSPGLATSYVQQSDVTKSGLGFGDTFIGLAGKDWGAFKVGTTYAPYKKSTDKLNPFSGQLGDYGVVMGNSGGDNRVEFGTRLDHSMWYESPTFAHGMSIDVLFSPGQNRTYDNVVQSAGSPDCNGGNIPGSGNLPLNCDDGGFDDAFSAALKFSNHGF